MSGAPLGGGGDQDVDEPVRVFMSYRRADDPHFVGRFHDRLVDEFGEDNVFRDLDSLHSGTDFADAIRREIGRMDAVVALIGASWSDRIGDPDDFVRMEIREAIEHGRALVPVLIETAQLPARADLPDDIVSLLDRNAVAVRRDPDFRRDAARVVAGIRSEATARRARLAEEAVRADAERQQAVAALEEEADVRRRHVHELAGEIVAREAEVRRLEDEDRARRLAAERAALDALLASRTAEQREIAEIEARLAEARVPHEPQDRVAMSPPVAVVGASPRDRPQGVTTGPVLDGSSTVDPLDGIAPTLIEPAVPVASAGVDGAPGRPVGDVTLTRRRRRFRHRSSPGVGPDPPVARTVRTAVAPPATAPAAAARTVVASSPTVGSDDGGGGDHAPADSVRLGARPSSGAAPGADLAAGGATWVVCVVTSVVAGVVVGTVDDRWVSSFQYDDRPARLVVWTVLAVAMLLLPLIGWRRRSTRAQVCVGVAIGYSSTVGILTTRSWYETWNDGDEPAVFFVASVVVVAGLLLAAWVLSEPGKPAPSWPPGSRRLRILALIAATIGLLGELRIADWLHEDLGYRPVTLVFLTPPAVVLMAAAAVGTPRWAMVGVTVGAIATVDDTAWFGTDLGERYEGAALVHLIVYPIASAALWILHRRSIGEQAHAEPDNSDVAGSGGGSAVPPD